MSKITNKFRGLVYAAILILACSHIVNAKNTFDELEVLKIPVSARASALGNSVFCSELDSPRYNPAYSAISERPYLFGTYGQMNENTNYGSVYATIRSNAYSTVKNMGVVVGVSQIVNKLDLYLDPDDVSPVNYSYTQRIVTIGPSYQLGKLLLALTFRGLAEDYASKIVSTNYIIDFGAGYLLTDRIHLGLVVNEAYQSVSIETDKLPLKGTIAGEWKPKLKLPSQSKDTANTLSLSLSKTNSLFAEMQYNVGWESVLFPGVALRFGLDNGYPAFGLGYRYKLYNIDIASVMKPENSLYFMTVGVRLGYTAEENIENAKLESERQKNIINVNEKAVNQLTAGTLIKEGWDLYKQNSFKFALERFNAALLIAPGNKSALDGQKSAQSELDKWAKKTDTELYIVEARQRYVKKEYTKSEELYRYALNSNPDSKEAKEGIRLLVETLDFEIGKYLEGGTTIQFGHGAIDGYTAQAISDTGSFGFLVNSLNFLSQKKLKEAYSEWSKIKPKDNELVQRYNGVITLLRSKEMANSMEKASKLFSDGYYADAVTEVDSNLAMTGLTPSEKKNITDLSASYEYRGKAETDTALSEASKAINNKDYSGAAASLNKVIKGGYRIDEAKKLMKIIKGELDKLLAQKNKDNSKLIAKYEEDVKDLYRAGNYKACMAAIDSLLSLDARNYIALRYINDTQSKLDPSKPGTEGTSPLDTESADNDMGSGHGAGK